MRELIQAIQEANPLKDENPFKGADPKELAQRKASAMGHAQKLVSDLEGAGFTDGVDVDPEISLLEYGILRNPKTGKVIFCHGNPDFPDMYNFDTITIDLGDVVDALSDISKSFFDFIGAEDTPEDYIQSVKDNPQYLSSVINDLCAYNGYFTDTLNFGMKAEDVRYEVLGRSNESSIRHAVGSLRESFYKLVED